MLKPVRKRSLRVANPMLQTTATIRSGSQARAPAEARVRGHGRLVGARVVRRPVPISENREQEYDGLSEFLPVGVDTERRPGRS